MPSERSQVGLRAVAAIEAAKGVLVLAVGLGLLTLINKDLQRIAEEIVGHLHLNPASHYASVFIHAIRKITDGQLWFLAGTALLYAILHLIEGYGLWWNMRWAKWLGVVTSGVYLPLEAYEILIQASWLKLFVLAVNIGVVGYLSCLLWRDRR